MYTPTSLNRRESSLDVSPDGCAWGRSWRISFETDRMRFIGRGNTIVNPVAMRDLSALSNSQGSVIDPVVAIRHGSCSMQENR